MVDPVSLGMAAAVLPASKFREGFAEDVGSSSRRAATDPDFASALRRLVDDAHTDNRVDVFVAHACDQARQVNVRGDHHRDITMS